MLTVRALTDLDENSTYRLTVSGIEDAVGNAMEEYSFSFSTGSDITEQPQPPSISALQIEPGQTVEENETITASVQVSNSNSQTGLEYRFRFADDQNYTQWSAQNIANTSYASAGSYQITAQVRNSNGSSAAATENVLVIEQQDEPTLASITSSPIALNKNGSELWVVNPDNNTITNIDLGSFAVTTEVRVGQNPSGIAIDSQDELWVTQKRDDDIAIFDNSGSLLSNIDLGYGSAPVSIVMDTDSEFAYVALQGVGEIVKIDIATKQIVQTLDGLTNVRGLALSADSRHLLATRFISPQHWGEVWSINPGDLTLNSTIKLTQHMVDDGIADGRGVPNYLSHITIDSAGRYAYVVGKKDNVNRGLLNTNDPLDDDNTVRTFAAVIDLASGQEIKERRVDFDNADSPSAVALSPFENYLFVALQGNNQVTALSLDSDDGVLSNRVVNITSGLAPQGLLVDRENPNLYVKNTNDRTLDQINLEDFIAGNVANPPRASISTVRRERVRADVLRGKQLFYNASYGLSEESEFTGRMSAEGYISCASCHFDGGQDGRTYDFTARGEGLRNNLSLLGRRGNQLGLLHWSGNFDEVQDFELDIRHRFLGRGLMSDESFNASADPLGVSKAGLSEDLDALAAYVNSLNRTTVPKSPYRNNDGSLTADAINGEAVFVDLDCTRCHSRAPFSDSRIHNVGTLREYSGFRLGEPLAGLRTPPLIGLFQSAPYLHDGSAATLEQVFTHVGGEVVQAEFTNYTGNAEAIFADGFSYLREGAAVKVGRGGQLELDHESSVERSGYIRVRYGSVTSPTDIVVNVNGTNYRKALEVLPLTEEQDTSFTEIGFIVDYLAGTNNIAVSVLPSQRGETVVIDDITISDEESEVLAEPHTVVNNLSDANKSDLFSFLRQIELGGNSRPSRSR
jgi:YVTN family beta-propeller protein